MPYYIRVLSTSERIIPASDISRALKASTLAVEAGTEEQWDALLLSHESGNEIALVERNPVAEGSMAAEEIDEFIEELSDVQPASGAEWLRAYLPKVKTIYAFQVLSGTDEAGGWSKLGAVKQILWNKLGGILQSDNEGFSNEDGYHIVWQFSERASGPWWMGLIRDGKWVHFQMELSNKLQRDAFLRGEVPPGIETKAGKST